MNFNLVDILSSFMVLFAVIDITGSLPIIIDLKNKQGKIESEKATLAAFGIMILFLFFGEGLLGVFGVDIASFAIAGSLVLLFLALEMILDIELFKNQAEGGGSSIVPLAFPLIAGAGTITTILSLRAEYATENIAVALLMNIVVVYIVLRATKFIERILGQGGIYILRKIFGVILLAIAIKLFLTNTGIQLN